MIGRREIDFSARVCIGTRTGVYAQREKREKERDKSEMLVV